MGIDREKLAALGDAYFNDVVGALSVATARIGDRLGLYKRLAAAGSAGMTSDELATATGCNRRLVLEWLQNQAGGNYVCYAAATETWFMTPEQAEMLANEDSPYFILGLHQTINGMTKAEARIAECFHHDKGLYWGDHDSDVQHGCSRFFRTNYEHKLIPDWIPRLEGLEALLREGVLVADIGPGLGYSTLAMAEAFPNSTFIGFDSHGPSMQFANNLARERGIANRVRFEVADATGIPAGDYRVITSFNCLHDVQHADKAARHYRGLLPDNGILFLAEPMAGRNLEENLVGDARMGTGVSVLCCTPHGITDNGIGLGTVVTDDRLKGIMLEAGFRTFRRVHEERFTRLFDIRP